MVRCLPNVFVTTNRISVFRGHFSLVQAQLNCMKEILKSSVKWKYYISLVGPDFPLYLNREIGEHCKLLKTGTKLVVFLRPNIQSFVQS